VLSFLISPIYVVAQMQQNADGTFNIGTLDGTAKILGKESASVDLTGAAADNRTVTLDADKKTIISSEAEVNALRDDQIATKDSGAAVVDVSSFFKEVQNSNDEVQDEIKKNIEDEIDKALNSIDVRSEDSDADRNLLTEKRIELFRDIDSYFQQENLVNDPDSVIDLNISINNIFKQIEDDLAEENLDGEKAFTFERVTIAETLLAYQKSHAKGSECTTDLW
jgi:hypothetical protein